MISEARLCSSAMKGFSTASLTADVTLTYSQPPLTLRVEVRAASEWIGKNVDLDLADSQLCGFE